MDTTAELYLEHEATPLSQHPSSTHKSETSNYYISCSDESFGNQIEDSGLKTRLKNGDPFRSVSEETFGVTKVSKDLTPIITIRCKTLGSIPERDFEHQMPKPDQQAHQDLDTQDCQSHYDLNTKDYHSHPDLNTQDYQSHHYLNTQDYQSHQNLNTKDDQFHQDLDTKNDQSQQNLNTKDDQSHQDQVTEDDRFHQDQVTEDDRSHNDQVSEDDRSHQDQVTEDDRSHNHLDTKNEQAHNDKEAGEQDQKDVGGNDQDIKDTDEQARKAGPKDDQSHIELVKKWTWNLPPVTLEVRLPYASVVRPSKENFYKVSKETLVESEGEGDGIAMAGSEYPENETGPDDDRSKPTKSGTDKEESSDSVPKTISAVARTGGSVTETTYALDPDGTETLKVSVDGWPRLTVTRKVGAHRYEGNWAEDPPTPPVGRSKTTCLLQANGSLFRMERFCDGPREVIALFKDNYLVCKVGKWLA